MSGAATRSGTAPIRLSRSSRRGDVEASPSRIMRPSFKAIGNAPFGQVIGSEFDEHFIAYQHADAVLAHLAGGMAKDFMSILEPDAKHGVGQKLNDLAAQFEKFFFGQKCLVNVSARGNRRCLYMDKQR